MAVTENYIIQMVVDSFPDVISIYLFGSYGTEYERSESDVDIALLLPHDVAKENRHLYLHPLHHALERLLRKDVDLINMRLVSTVLQIQILKADRLIYCSDRYAVDVYEAFVMSSYQRLNRERREIIEDGLKSGSFVL